MKKVYQTIINKTKGNCMQAAFASLFELPIEKVPDFISMSEDVWFKSMCNFIKDQGYEFRGSLYNPNDLKNGRNDFDRLKNYKGVNGYHFAAVYSPKYYKNKDKSPVTHAVIVDNDLNIVHDVNPNNKDLKEYPEKEKLKYNGILYVYIIEKIL